MIFLVACVYVFCESVNASVRVCGVSMYRASVVSFSFVSPDRCWWAVGHPGVRCTPTLAHTHTGGAGVGLSGLGLGLGWAGLGLAAIGGRQTD